VLPVKRGNGAQDRAARPTHNSKYRTMSRGAAGPRRNNSCEMSNGSLDDITETIVDRAISLLPHPRVSAPPREPIGANLNRLPEGQLNNIGPGLSTGSV